MKHRKIPIGSKNIIGRKVASLRKAKGLKQKDLLARLQAEGMDITSTSLSRLEGHQRSVQDYELPIIARVLGVSLDELLSEEEAP